MELYVLQQHNRLQIMNILLSSQLSLANIVKYAFNNQAIIQF